ncbi:MAG: glutamate formiminotransferase [Nitrospirales bacterium]|nr:MAG: glutamate formiminotransferase [Nitrospirales bacterium]
MKKLVECVPNISEGRDLDIINALAEVVQRVENVVLLDRHCDIDHHRSVFTIVGIPEAVLNVVYQLTRHAMKLIDLSKHEGVHPRVGVVDVVPFIPLEGVTMAECITLAQCLGKKIGEELTIPVFLYAQASPLNPPRSLEVIRRGGWSGLSERMEKEGEWRPDFGPQNLHATAGAVSVGARDFLIAYNVLLQSNDLSIAQAIAKSIRTSGGGLLSLKAMGVALPSRGVVQVSMNLTNYQETSLYDAYCAVQEGAERYGVGIEESELVGLAPQAAIPPEYIKTLKFRNWNPDQILETRLVQTGFKYFPLFS